MNQPLPAPSASLPTLPCTPADRVLCAVQAAWLHAVLQLAPLAWLLQLGVLLPCLAPAVQGVPRWAMLLTLMVLALAERYHALRLHLDARLFAQIGSGQIASLADLDAGLQGMGLRSVACGQPTRSLPRRMQGCQRLVRRYVACVAALAALLGVALWYSGF